MACHWQDVPGVGMVHFNIARPRKRRCAHCDCPDAKALCDWPVIKLARFKVNELAVEDIVASPAGTWRARIDSLEFIPQEGEIKFHATVIATGAKTAFALFPANVHLMRVERPDTCNKPCCFRCRRHVGPDKDYCRDHWDLDGVAFESALRIPVSTARGRGRSQGARESV